MTGNAPYDLEDGDRFFRRKAEEFSGSIREWDEIVTQLLYALARNPQIGRLVPGHHEMFRYLIRSDPPMTLFYSIDEDRKLVRLLDLFLLRST